MNRFLFKYWPFLIILGLTVLITWPLVMPGYFSHHDDLQVMRVFEMRRCLLDLQIPCRWVPDMGYGNGYPLFNYYGVLPYYIGAFASFFLGFLNASKLLFAIPLFLGSISIYFLASELFGIYPAITAAILYTFAPFRALDVYVRGDITESFATAIIPLCFYFALKIIRYKGIKNIAGLSISLALFLTSHNIMSLLFIPVLFVFIIFWSVIEKWKNIIPLVRSLLLGFGLSAFFIIPSYFEKNLVQIDNLIRLDLNFRAHFVTINQLFLSRFWGYGASVPGPNDTISFQIGWPHWWIAIVCFPLFLFRFILKKKHNFLPVILIGMFLLSIFMSHIKSAFIWEKIDILKFTQFPWRFLGLTVFSTSLLGGYLISAFNDKYKKYTTVGIVLLTIILNWSYFKPKEFYYDLTDQKKLSGNLWEEQQKASLLDYLPKTALKPTEPALDKPMIQSENAVVENFENKSNKWQFRVKTETKTSIEVPIFDFPNWEVFANGQKISHSNNNFLGRIQFDLNSGNYQISGNFNNTSIRTISNMLSLISGGVLIFLIYGKNKFKKL